MEKEQIYHFSSEKNALLKAKRGISFDEVIAAIENDQVMDVIMHPNDIKYPDQEIMIVNIKSYIYMVPFVKHPTGGYFLKTIYPGRKAKKAYEIGEHTHDN